MKPLVKQMNVLVLYPGVEDQGDSEKRTLILPQRGVHKLVTIENNLRTKMCLRYLKGRCNEFLQDCFRWALTWMNGAENGVC